MSELKPCPFCGSPAYSYHDNCIDFAGVKCDLGGCVCADILITENNWNTRPIEDALRLRIAELEAEIECEMRVFKDGNAWCFVLPDFQDLQVSSSVWMKEGVLDKIYKELRSVRNESNYSQSQI